MDGLVRFSPGTRRTLQVVGIVLVAAGITLVVVGFAAFTSSGPGEGFGGGFAMFMAGGFVLMIGLVLASLGFWKAVVELASTESGPAVEHSSAAVGRGVGRGLGQSGVSSGARTIVKVRCPACGELDSEDARFCSACGAAMGSGKRSPAKAKVAR